MKKFFHPATTFTIPSNKVAFHPSRLVILSLFTFGPLHDPKKSNYPEQLCPLSETHRARFSRFLFFLLQRFQRFLKKVDAVESASNEKYRNTVWRNERQAMDPEITRFQLTRVTTKSRASEITAFKRKLPYNYDNVYQVCLRRQ